MGIEKGWRVWIFTDAEDNNPHSFVSVFGSDRYMHVMTAMTANHVTYDADWWKKVALTGTE